MNIELPGTAGPAGWPAADCHCASCARLRAAGVRYEPFSALIDGVPLAGCPQEAVPGGRDVRAPSGGRILVAEPGGRPEPRGVYDAVFLDPAVPDHLGRLRDLGAVRPDTRVVPVHLDHRLRSPEELERRLSHWLDPVPGPHRTLLLGGTRSGKSAEAELRLAACPDVTYLATSAPRDDAEWSARVEAHRRRRPSWWRTVETTALPEALESAAGAVLVDGIGTWLTAAIDEAGAWDAPHAILPRLDELIGAWRRTPARVVAVSDEVGLSLVPTTASGRAFRDLLGLLNQRLAAESEEAALVVAGRVVGLP
ncbi:bifunctional adenosylcobinamide kinase/adenosylcobinamide-phosphate guanylyltransferase [Spirillospora sp. NPDC029432]|uniref:bifunctional adenosylcobinamide kinase/adenosylcobinamide-phosphate guanylyltransferase n=1 Tax=Spirillospora sp. NPDC029432 TaxID=3154599 RepID=UPI003456F5A6